MSANDEKPLFGRIAVARRLITEEQLEECLQAQTQSKTHRLGEILVERGFMTEEEVYRVIRIQQTQMKTGVTRKPGVASLAFGIQQGESIDGYFVKRELHSDEFYARFEVVKSHNSYVMTVLSDALTISVGDRFQTANKALKNLDDSKSIARVVDYGAIREKAFVVTDFFSDESLASQLIRNPRSESQAIDVLLQLAESLQVAHDVGIIHGFLSSRCVFQDGKSVVAHQFAAAPEKFMLPGLRAQWDIRSVAPEQLESAGEVDPRTDIYALGVVGFELAVGQSPFSGSSEQLLDSILKKRPASLVTTQNQYSVGFDAICSKAMSKQPEGRYQSAAELREDLLKLKSGQQVSAPSRRGTRRIFGWIRGIFKQS